MTALTTYSPDDSSETPAHDQPSALSADSAVDDRPDVDQGDTAATDSTQAGESAQGDDEPADSSPESLFTPEERAAFQAEPDLEKRQKGMEKAFFAKTRQLAEERKALGPWTHVARAWQTDREGTVRALAKELGLEIPSSAPNTSPAASETPASPPPDPIADAASEIQAALGEDYEDLAVRLAPVFAKVVDRLVEARTKPIESKLETRDQVTAREEAERQSALEIETFAKRHPDWQKHEAAMLALMPKLPAGKGVESQEYLDMLYTLATKDVRVAEEAKKTIGRMQRSASAATQAGAGMAADKVVEKSQGPISFDEAARLARQGIRLQE